MFSNRDFILSLGALFLTGLFLLGHDTRIVLFVLAFFYALFAGYNIVLNHMQNAARLCKVVAFHQGVGEWLRYLIPLGLLVVLSDVLSVDCFHILYVC